MDATNLRIIIGDEEPAHAEAIRRAFEAADIAVEIETAFTMAAYHKAVAARPPDIALVDLNLPEDGTVAVLIAPPEAGPYPVLVMTSYGNEQAAGEVMKAGALDLVIKSAEAFAAMPRIVARALREWQLHQECKRADEALRESQAMMNAIIDSTSDMIWSVDPESFGLLSFNRGLSDYFLRQRGMRIQAGMRPEDLFPTEVFIERWCGLYHRALSEGPYTTEYLVYAGSSILQLSFNLLKRDDKLFGISVFGKDITERKRAEDALRLQGEIIGNMSEGVNLIRVSDLVIAYTNPRFDEMFGYSPGELIGKHVSVLNAPTESSPREVAGRIQESLDRHGYWRGEIHNIKKDGALFWCLVSVSMFDHPQSGRTFISIHTDITDHKRAESALAETETYLRMVLSSAPISIFAIDHQGLFTLSAGKGLERVGLNPGENVGVSARDLYGAISFVEYNGSVTTGVDVIQRAFAGETMNAMNELRGVCFDNRIGPIRDTEGKVIGIVGVATDITDRRRAEEALRRRAAELAALQATVLDITSSHELPTLLYTIVERAAQLLGARGGGMYLCDPGRREARCVVSYNTPHDYTGTILAYGEGAAGTVAQTGKPLMIADYRAWDKRAAVYDKEEPFTAVLSAPMIWQDQVIGVIHVLDDVESKHFTETDPALLTLFANHAAIAVENTRLYEAAQNEITERKRAEEVLRASLTEKDVLLTEVQHRVKNNLAAIMGLLQLQRETVTDPATVAQFRELEGRVRSMALVYETLYQAESVARIDLQRYFETLIAQLRTALATPAAVRFRVAASGVEMGLGTAIPCGLILNELITNALKYAFPRGQPRLGETACEITVSAQWARRAEHGGVEYSGGVYTLTIADNGVGLPADLDWATTKTLGLRLVRLLAQHQLGGNIEIDRTGGTRFVLQFGSTHWR